jgi:hypothetical protein
VQEIDAIKLYLYAAASRRERLQADIAALLEACPAKHLRLREAAGCARPVT